MPAARTPRSAPSRLGRLRPFARRRHHIELRERDLAARDAEVEELAASLRQRHEAFVRAVAHQLRTPLATLMVASDALRPERGELPAAERDELVDILIRQGEKLRGLIEDVVALIDPSETLQPDEVVTPIPGTLASLATQYLPARPVEIVADDDAVFDAALALRLLAPLLRNVADHTPADAAVRLKGGPHPELRGTFRLSVEDGGPGVEDVTAVVEAFRQGRVASRQASPGLGLGLTVVDALARALGGSLVLGRSELGGLEATLLLPDTLPDETAAAVSEGS
ncbi:MAG: HAMP domain-containing histidine kinase [Actinobacteria bacterium]|nr:HAMP domain-containing histidine kinase [Actinomycetota bacterium]